MSSQNPLILFVGGNERGSKLQEYARSQNWGVYRPDSAVEALRIHDTFSPDMVVIEATPGNRLAQKVYDTLREFGTKRMLVLTHDPRSYKANRMLSRDCTSNELVSAIGELMKKPG